MRRRLRLRLRRLVSCSVVVAQLLLVLLLVSSCPGTTTAFVAPSIGGNNGGGLWTTSSNTVNRQIFNQRQRPFATSSSSFPRQSSSSTMTTTTTCLKDSLQALVDNIKAASGTKQTIFVGGKGGVGKTSVSSALAVQLAMEDFKVLVISTDPAHSLGDALDVELRANEGRPMVLTDPLTQGRLSAAEVNAEAALRDFRESLAGFDVERLADSLGVSAELLESLGLREFSGLLNNPPPGIDELVALGNVMDDKTDDYDVVIVDTAPTGHSLRLLALPQFLDGLLGKLLQLRMKLAGLTNTLKMFLGDKGAQERTQNLDNAMDRVETFRRKIGRLEKTLKDKTMTSFLIVTVPTKLAVEESKRLLTELTKEGIAVNHIVVNQCVEGEGGTSTKEALENYYNRRVAGQQKWITKLKQAAADVSSTKEYQSNGDDGSAIAISELPFFDVELVGVPALGYVGAQHLANNPSFQSLMKEEGRGERREPKVVICGGKGGVGKTTTSSSLAVTMAAQGHKVCLISTDPAHSLGDAVDMDLKGGKMIDCPLYGVPSANIGEGSLSVMEIDPSSALSEFKSLVDQLIGSNGGGSGGSGGGSDGSDVRGTLQDLESVFDTLPPGTDEIVALAKVVKLVKEGNFDRIVLDTAPTGHTTRLLGLPSFLADLIDRLLSIASKVSSNLAVKMFIASAAGGDSEKVDATAASAKSKLLSFQLQMYDMEDLFANPDQTEFLIVTVPTELAVRESVRLLNDLTFESPEFPIKVRNIVVNQVLRDDGSDVNTFLTHVSDGQKTSMTNLEQALNLVERPPRITKVRYLDTEPRGVFGLKVLGDELLKEDEEVVLPSS